jgi:trk system potassium uptake protein TrkA
MTITRLNKIEYMPLVRAIGLEHIVSPRQSAVNSIFKHVRKGGVISAVAIKDGAEALEALVSPDSTLVGQSLKDLSFPRGVLVLCIMREDAVLIPGGHDVIIGGDRLFILSLTESIPAVEQMLSQGREQI